jgi:hypothetical protein
MSLARKLRQLAEWKRDSSSDKFPMAPFPDTSTFKNQIDLDSTIHALSNPPVVQTRVFFPNPSMLSSNAEAFAENDGTVVARGVKSSWPSPTFWEKPLPAGLYGIGVKDPLDSSRNHTFLGAEIQPAFARIPEPL